MSGPAKPVHEYFKHLQYLRHKTKLATIEHEKPEPVPVDMLASAHRLRSQAQTFHQMELDNAISSSNEKLLQKLLSISKRRPSAYAQTVTPAIASFHNPARKKRERMITEMNQQMAERMLTRESPLGQGHMRRSIQQYERIKRTIANNKRALSLAHTAHLPALPQTPKPKRPTHNHSQDHHFSRHEPILIRYEETEDRHEEGGTKQGIPE